MEIEIEREYLEDKLNLLIQEIGDIPIASPSIMPFGWRKAAKGRTVWRIVEEVINQSLEYYSNRLGFESVCPADSEVSIFDFSFSCDGNKKSYANIKSAVIGGRTNKDDISKAVGLLDFFNNNPSANLYVATFIISFKDDLTIGLEECIVFPTAWIPDVYVNPSNNGNLQSSSYKELEKAVRRTPEEFFQCLVEANNVAVKKKEEKRMKGN